MYVPPITRTLPRLRVGLLKRCRDPSYDPTSEAYRRREKQIDEEDERVCK